MKNIAFAKIGKSIKFNNTSYSPIGGDNEPGAVLRALANSNPDKTFYLVGRSDFSRLPEDKRFDQFPYDNVIDCFGGSGSVCDNPGYLCDWFSSRNITIDFGFMMIGQIGTVTIPNKVQQIKDRTLIASVIDMTKNYATPTINWLNENHNIKWIEIINDPRYTKAQTRDFISEPVKSLGQFNYTYTHSRIKSFEDQDRFDVEHNAVYAGMETAFCIDRKYPKDISSIKKTNDMTIILNEGTPSRYNQLNEWILSNFNNVEVYGRWENELAISDSRFKGSLHIDEVQKKVLSSKYTFIIPIAKGWVTSKYIEMIHAGCIPFFHPEYDEQRHLDVPEILRVKTPKDLLDSIDILNNDDNLRLNVLKELQSNILLPEYYDGSFMNYILMSEAYDCIGQDYVQCNVSEFSKKEIVGLF